MKKLIEQVFSKHNFKHLTILFGFGLFSVLFFYPVLTGKKMIQSDIRQYTGMSRQIQEYRQNNNEEIYWIDNAFGGMPTYQLGARYPYDFLTPIHQFFQLIPQPAEILFLYLLMAYLFLLIIKMPIPVAIFGAFAYGLSTYLLIILQVGHNTKAQALAYMPLVIGGMYMILDDQRIKGFVLTVIALSMQIRANHYQITYYMLLLMFVIGIVYGIRAIKIGEHKNFLHQFLILTGAGLLSLGLNAPPLLATAEYSQFSTRGKSELNQNSDGSLKDNTGGLSTDYITQFSYGIFESFNLLAPRIQGGGSSENLGENSELYDFLIQNGLPRSQAKSFVSNVPTYWGSQPILEAPAYVGVTVAFMAFLTLFIVKGPLRNGLLAGIILSLLLSWGKNFSLLTDIFIDYFPLYNKFRAVSSIQVILEFCIPVLASLGLYRFFQKPNGVEFRKILKPSIGFIIVILIILISKSFFSFSGVVDTYLREAYGPVLMDQIIKARKSIFNYDLIRAIIYCLLVCAVMYYFTKGKISKNFSVMALICLMLIDLIGISQRYIDRDLFVSPRQIKNLFVLKNGDQLIQRDTGRFRVYEPGLKLSGARTSFFHNAIGGYHGAKPRRFEELYEYFSAHQISGVMDMLNVKYLVIQENNEQKIIENPNVLGMAWAVDSLLIADTADKLLESMKSIDFSRQAVVLKSELPDGLGIKFDSKQLNKIELVKSHPANLVYDFEASEDQLLVFSEMYYPHGWSVAIDDQNAAVFPVNYVLRGLRVPSGKHTIEFTFDPPVIRRGKLIRLTSLFIFISVLSYFGYQIFKQKSN
ncbi:MAG: YfhO family protein [Flavobacteriaceae bacterium]